MTRIRSPHDFHETKKHDTENICAKCGKMTPKLCDWCGACLQCHTGNTLERTY
jgi:predicted ATP-dependent serine protease